jgi:hypothetical protein
MNSLRLCVGFHVRNLLQPARTLVRQSWQGTRDEQNTKSHQMQYMQLCSADIHTIRFVLNLGSGCELSQAVRSNAPTFVSSASASTSVPLVPFVALASCSI